MLLVVEYIKKKGWKHFKEDFQEYKKLKKACKNLERRSIEAHFKLTCDKAEYLKQHKPLSCVRSVTKDCFNMYDADGVSVYFSTEYCGNFLPGPHDAPKCQRKDCPYVELNNQAYELIQHYKDLMHRKNEFWKNKVITLQK